MRCAHCDVNIEIENKSERISQLIHEQLDNGDDLQLRHNTPFGEWNTFKSTDNILVLGLNPSSADIDETGKDNCFVHYVPTTSPSKIINGMKKKGYIYEKYFKKPYELFSPYEYKPIWTNKTYLNSKKEDLSADEYTLLNSFPDSKKYLIFSDLLHYKETNSKNISNIIEKNADLKTNIIELFLLQIDFFNPKIVFVNNAYTSSLLLEHLPDIQDSKVHTSIDYGKTKIVFSSLLTGPGAIDRFSYERLKAEIDRIMIEINTEPAVPDWNAFTDYGNGTKVLYQGRTLLATKINNPPVGCICGLDNRLHAEIHIRGESGAPVDYYPRLSWCEICGKIHPDFEEGKI